MTEVRMTTDSWQDDLVNLLDDATIPFIADPFNIRKSDFVSVGQDPVEPESFKDQAKEFAMAWGEMMLDLGKGFKDIVEQNLMTEDSFVVQKLGKPCAKVSGRLRFLNEYLPEDRDPVHVWPVILSVFILALAVISINSGQSSPIRIVKKVQIHPPSATRIQLPDGRHIAYDQQGVPAGTARFTIMIPHSFLFSRLAGIPGVKAPLLEEYGIRLITYDLPGFGESDPHPSRNLNSSALDMLYLANAVGVTDKFWVFGFSTAAMHTWAALKYIPDRIAGVALVAPMVNPYEATLSKEERNGAWANWGGRRKLLYFLSRRFQGLLSILYRRKFFSGEHGQIDEWLSLPLQGKDEVLAQEQSFEEYWHRNVEESIRQGSSVPLVEESALLVSNWGFKLSDFQLQRKCQTRGLLPWLKSLYNQDQCELTGFLGPIHIWQGMEDKAVPPSVTDYIARVLPQATIHRLPNESHFSYLFFCDGCHQRIFSTLFGAPQGPVNKTTEKEDSTELPSQDAISNQQE